MSIASCSLRRGLLACCKGDKSRVGTVRQNAFQHRRAYSHGISSAQAFVCSVVTGAARQPVCSHGGPNLHAAVIARGMSSFAESADSSQQESENRKLTSEDCLLALRFTAETLESPDIASILPSFPATDDIPETQQRLFLLIATWQKALSLAQQVQMEAISKFGLSPSASGLRAFEQQISKMEDDDVVAGSLAGLRRRKWQAILTRVFKLECQFDPLPVAKVREVTEALLDAVKHQSFVSCLNLRLSKLGDGASPSDRKAVIMEQHLQKQFAVLETFDFHGENGYLRFQAAVLVHVTDPVVADNISSAYSSIRDMISGDPNKKKKD